MDGRVAWLTPHVLEYLEALQSHKELALYPSTSLDSLVSKGCCEMKVKWHFLLG